MSVQIKKETDRKGRVISKECMNNYKACQHEGSSVCYGCSVYVGDGSKENLFKEV